MSCLFDSMLLNVLLFSDLPLEAWQRGGLGSQSREAMMGSTEALGDEDLMWTWYSWKGKGWSSFNEWHRHCELFWLKPSPCLLAPAHHLLIKKSWPPQVFRKASTLVSTPRQNFRKCMSDDVVNFAWKQKRAGVGAVILETHLAYHGWAWLGRWRGEGRNLWEWWHKWMT